MGSIIEAGYPAVLFDVHVYRENHDGEEINPHHLGPSG